MAAIAMPVAEDFEDSEFTVPFDRFKNDGHEVTVIGRKAGEIVIGKRRQWRCDGAQGPPRCGSAHFGGVCNSRRLLARPSGAREGRRFLRPPLPRYRQAG